MPNLDELRAQLAEIKNMSAFALAVGVNRKTIWRICQGGTPSLPTLKKLLDGLEAHRRNSNASASN